MRFSGLSFFGADISRFQASSHSQDLYLPIVYGIVVCWWAEGASRAIEKVGYGWGYKVGYDPNSRMEETYGAYGYRNPGNKARASGLAFEQHIKIEKARTLVRASLVSTLAVLVKPGRFDF